jgi:hypothetical protein
MFIDDCAAVAHRRVHLDRRRRAQKTDGLTSRDAGGQHVGSVQDPPQLGWMGIELPDLGARAKSGGVVAQRMVTQPDTRARPVPVSTGYLLGRDDRSPPRTSRKCEMR